MSSELLLMNLLQIQRRDVKHSMTLLLMLVTSLLLFWVNLLVLQLKLRLILTKIELIVSKLIHKLNLMSSLLMFKRKEISLTNGSQTDLNGLKRSKMIITGNNSKKN